MIKYVEWHTLQSRGAVDPGYDEPVDGTLLVGEVAALIFTANQSSYGEDYVSIYPAFHNGKRCWLKQAAWDPAEGYSASGTQETIMDFDAGVKLFLERGVFEFPVPTK